MNPKLNNHKDAKNVSSISGDDLKLFYKNYFDINALWRVIKKENFPRQEFGFSRFNSFFVRNKSFESSQDLKEYLSLFPITAAYIGAVYEDSVRMKTKNYDAITIHDTKWLGRELIFDLDANDYDLVRTCDCKGRSVCSSCWGLLQDAAKVIDETLKDDFGFENIHWVFTGGRGYHCWVTDDNTLKFSQKERLGIINHLQLIHNPLEEQRVEKIKNKDSLLYKRVYRLLLENFIKESPPKVLKMLKVKRNLALEQMKCSTHHDFSKFMSKSVNEETFFETLVKYRYPRIDHKVTIDTRRLIRVPGSIHFHTGLVSQFVDNPATFFPKDAKHITDFA